MSRGFAVVGTPLSKGIFTLVFFIFSSSLYSQTINTNWKEELANSLNQFLDCQNKKDGNAYCNGIVGESLNKVYKLNDFYSQKLRRYLMPSEISEFLKGSNTWTLLGHSYDQKALITAQEYANAKKAVVAVYMNTEGIGHVVLITPGELHESGSWGLKVPSSASFSIVQPDKSFIDKGLSYAFPKNVMKDILLYVRNY